MFTVIRTVPKARPAALALRYTWNTLAFSTSTGVQQSQRDNKHYDVIIVGGGMVGTTLACSLGKRQFPPRELFLTFLCFPAKESVLKDKRVLLLEGAPEFKGASKEKYSNRVSALSPGTADLMHSLGAWDYIKSVRHREVKQMQVTIRVLYISSTVANACEFLQVWDACSDAYITFSHDNFEKNVAYIVENDLILEAVYKQLVGLENVTVKNSSRLEKCTLYKDCGQTSVTLNGGETYNCDLLVSPRYKLLFNIASLLEMSANCRVRSVCMSSNLVSRSASCFRNNCPLASVGFAWYGPGVSNMSYSDEVAALSESARTGRTALKSELLRYSTELPPSIFALYALWMFWYLRFRLMLWFRSRRSATSL